MQHAEKCVRLRVRPVRSLSIVPFAAVGSARRLRNRKPLFERLREDGARIKLSVCMDEGVMLVLTGIGTPHSAIVVSTSEDDIRWESTSLRSANDPNGGG